MAFTWNEDISIGSSIDLSDIVEMRNNLDSIKDALANVVYDNTVFSSECGTEHGLQNSMVYSYDDGNDNRSNYTGVQSGEYRYNDGTENSTYRYVFNASL